LLAYGRVVWRKKKLIFIIVTMVTVLVAAISLFLPKKYRAETLLLPVSSNGGGGLSTIASDLGGIASLMGIGISGVSDQMSKIMAIINSRTLAENVIERANLKPVLFDEEWNSEKGVWINNIPPMEDAVRMLRKSIDIVDDKKENTIKISGVFADPQLAAHIVNTFVDELQKFINANAFTVAKRNRIFIEGQLEQNKRELLESGKEINEFYNTNKVSNVDAKVNVPINGLGIRDSGLENRDSDKTLYAMNDPVENPHGAAIDSLMASKTELDKKITEAKVVRNVPQQVYLTYLMMRRELLAKINSLLVTQYEMAKIEEAKDELAFEIIDRAVPPLKKFMPRRVEMCVIAFISALFVMVIGLFFVEYFRRMKTDV